MKVKKIKTRINLNEIKKMIRSGSYKLVQFSFGRRSDQGCLLAAHCKLNGIKVNRNHPFYSLEASGFNRSYMNGIVDGFDEKANHVAFRYFGPNLLEYERGYKVGIRGLEFLRSLKKK